MGACSLPLWIIGGLIFVICSKPAWQTAPSPCGRPQLGLIGLAVTSVLVWLPILPLTQPEQQRRRIAEKLFQAGERAEAIRFMSSYPRQAFPPHWTLPGTIIRFNYDQERQQFLALLEELSDEEAAPWVREAYFQIAREVLGKIEQLFMGPEQWHEFGQVLQQSSEGRAILQEMKGNPIVYRLLRGETDPVQVPKH